MMSDLYKRVNLRVRIAQTVLFAKKFSLEGFESNRVLLRPSPKHPSFLEFQNSRVAHVMNLSHASKPSRWLQKVRAGGAAGILNDVPDSDLASQVPTVLTSLKSSSEMGASLDLACALEKHETRVVVIILISPTYMVRTCLEMLQLQSQDG